MDFCEHVPAWPLTDTPYRGCGCQNVVYTYQHLKKQFDDRVTLPGSTAHEDESLSRMHPPLKPDIEVHVYSQVASRTTKLALYAPTQVIVPLVFKTVPTSLVMPTNMWACAP
jgi:hypothetical protein